MRRGSQKTGLRIDLNYKQRHHLTKMMSIITLIFLLVQTFLSPISQYVNAQGNGLGISLSTSSINETEILVATLIDTGDESNGPLSFTVPEGLAISGIVAGQENIEAISNGNHTLQFNWKENSNKAVQVQVQAQKAGDYTATFSSSDSNVYANVTVTEPVVEPQIQEDTVVVENPNTEGSESKVSGDEEASEDGEGDNAVEPPAQEDNVVIENPNTEGSESEIPGNEEENILVNKGTDSTDKNKAIEITKTVNTEYADPGEEVTFTIEVKNNRDKKLKNINLTNVINQDNQDSSEELYEKTFDLKKGESKTFTVDYTIPEDAECCTVYNSVATATYESTDTDITRAIDNATVTDNAAVTVKEGDKDYFHGDSNYNHIDILLAAGDITYIVDGETYTLSGSVVKDTIKVTVGETTYTGSQFSEAEEDPSRHDKEYRLMHLNLDPDATVTIECKIQLDFSKLTPDEINFIKKHFTVDSNNRITFNDSFTEKDNVCGADVGHGRGFDFEVSGKELGEYFTTGSLTIKKVDSESKATVLAGATFTLTDSKGNTLTDSTGKVIEQTTDENGIATFTKVPFGKYTLTEIKSPEGYLLPSASETWEVEISKEEREVSLEIANTLERPSLLVTKTADHKDKLYEPGEKVTYTIEVTNTGNTKLKDIELKDVFSKVGSEEELAQLNLKDGDNELQPFDLAPTASKTITAEFTVPTTDLAGTQYQNTVKAVSGEVESNTAEETITVDAVPGLEVTKTADKNIAKPGETVTYTITVSNTGNMDLKATLSGVFSENGKVMDKQLVAKDADGNEYNGEEFTLAYGETVRFTAEYTIPEDAKANTVYHNVVTVVSGDLIITDDADVTVDEVPNLKVEKTADKPQYLPGETVTYTINVTNDGNVDLEDITLNDIFSKNDVVANQQLKVEGYEGAFDLAIGETMSFTSKFVIPENDLADTTYKNVVTTTTGDVSGEDEVVIVVDPTYAFTIEKTADKTEATVGETVTYTIVVTNTGNKALTNVHVKDDMIDLDTVIDQLDVKESKTLTGEYVVTADDIGELKNIATASVEMDGTSIVNEASVTVNVSAVAAVDEEPPTTVDNIVNWVQNPKTGDTTINILLILFIFVLAGSGLYLYRRKYRG